MTVTPQVLAVAAAVLVLAAAALVLLRRRGGRRAAEAARAEGRAKVVAVLEALPGSLIFPHVSIDFNGRLGEIDVLVLRDNGIFAIETESAAGTVRVSNAPDWAVSGPGLGRRSIRNPIARAMRNIRTLKQRLEGQSFPVRPQIEVVVCLTHESAKPEVADAQRAPVLTLPELGPYLLARPDMSPKNAHEASKLRVFLLDNGGECTDTGGVVCAEQETA